jgi:hypothetical protein
MAPFSPEKVERVFSYGLSWLTALRVQASNKEEVNHAYHEDQESCDQAA